MLVIAIIVTSVMPAESLMGSPHICYTDFGSSFLIFLSWLACVTE